MRLATWNVNSLRSRMPRLEPWLERVQPDVVALQETKLSTHDPALAGLERRFAALGYDVAHHGTGGYAGVALASRVGLEDVVRGLPGEPSYDGRLEPRAVGATCGGVRIWSLYAPNGRRLRHPHWDYKLAWLEALRTASAGWLAADPGLPLVLAGDYNVAPLEEDVWSVDFWSTRTHFSPPERVAFAALLDAGLLDLARPHTPGPGVYTFWEHLHERFAKRQGLRIDFLLGSRAVAARVQGAAVDVAERGSPGTSDHAPVVLQIADPA